MSGEGNEVRRAAVIDAWRVASDDLRVRAVAPFAVGGAEFVAYVPCFGSASGTLVALIGDGPEARKAAEAVGSYFSMINPAVYSHYAREVFVEVLTDWGWFGDADQRPAWLS